MASPYRLIIFDWDGTLMDSTDRIAYCMQCAAEDVGVPIPTTAEVKNIIGLGLSIAVEQLFPDLDSSQANQVCRHYSEHFIHNKTRTSALYEGALEVLDTLKQRRLMMAIATGKSRRGLNREFENYALEHYFAISRCADETQSKPHPAMLDEILQEMECPRGEALMIGDTEYDMEMGVRAGVDCVAVSYGAHSHARLQSYKPKVTLSAINELIPWLDRAVQ